MNKIILFSLLFAFLLSATGLANAKPEINHQAEFAATSHFSAVDYRGGKYKSVMNINQSKNRARYSYPGKKYFVTNILRYDKGRIWNVHPEQQSFPGIKLYQELKLTNGPELNAHLKLIAKAKQHLKEKKHIKKIGVENIEGVKTTHYQCRKPNEFYEGEFYTVDFWISDNGILVKMKYQGKIASGLYELKNIKLGKQDDSLFEPPAGYEKRGPGSIQWKKEKRRQRDRERKKTNNQSK